MLPFYQFEQLLFDLYLQKKLTNFYMIYIFIQTEHLFEPKTECFALICLHIPY